MRIMSVQNYNFINNNKTKINNYQTNSTVSNPDSDNRTGIGKYSYGLDLVNRPQTTFTGNEISKTAIVLAQQLPIEDRLASIFQILKHGDILLLGKDFNKAQVALKKHLSKLRQVIRKEYFVPDSKIENNYAFIRNAMGEIELLNINDKKLIYMTGGKKYYLEPDTSFYVVNNDTIQYANDVIHLKDKPKADLSTSRHIFSRMFDYSENVQTELAKLNAKTVNTMIVPAKAGAKAVTFADIGGQAKAIKELKHSILFPVKNPEGFTGDDITRGFILYGPAGTGKTELCRALANEAGMNSSYISGASFQNKWVGGSEENVRNWFDALKENQPSIGIIDEIDAIANKRSGQDVYGDKLVDQILTCMTDIYNENDNVFILGLTNKYNMLDDAIKRAERFSKHILVGEPDRDGVAQILKIHTRNRQLDPELNIDALVDEMYKIRTVGSDIKFITKLAKENMMERLGLYEKMENGTFKASDMENAMINQADFMNAIESFKKQHRTSSRKPIGYNI